MEHTQQDLSCMEWLVYIGAHRTTHTEALWVVIIAWESHAQLYSGLTPELSSGLNPYKVQRTISSAENSTIASCVQDCCLNPVLSLNLFREGVYLPLVLIHSYPEKGIPLNNYCILYTWESRPIGASSSKLVSNHH